MDGLLGLSSSVKVTGIDSHFIDVGVGVGVEIACIQVSRVDVMVVKEGVGFRIGVGIACGQMVWAGVRGVVIACGGVGC